MCESGKGIPNFKVPAEWVYPEFSSAMDSICAGIALKIRQDAFGALGKEVHELTEAERFAIAYLAGVPVVMRDLRDPLDDGKFRMRLEPCVIGKVDGKFRVWRQGKETGSRIELPEAWRFYL